MNLIEALKSLPGCHYYDALEPQGVRAFEWDLPKLPRFSGISVELYGAQAEVYAFSNRTVLLHQKYDSILQVDELLSTVRALLTMYSA